MGIRRYFPRQTIKWVDNFRTELILEAPAVEHASLSDYSCSEFDPHRVLHTNNLLPKL